MVRFVVSDMGKGLDLEINEDSEQAKSVERREK